MRASIPRAGRAGPALVAALAACIAVGPVRADAAAGLADLRLFATPARRAELDGEPPAPAGPSPEAAESTPTGTSTGTAAPSRDRPDAARVAPPAAAVRTTGGRGAPPPGSATLRSSRGTSRIVDGVPLPDGPS